MKTLPLAAIPVCLTAFAVQTAHAGGEIVFSARFYYPPSQGKRESHWHLYRVDPSGRHLRQITFGNFDDEDPHWSRDGTQIYFTRRHDTNQGPDDGRDDPVFVVRADGGHDAPRRAVTLRPPPNTDISTDTMRIDCDCNADNHWVLVMKPGQRQGEKRIPLHLSATLGIDGGGLRQELEAIPGDKKHVLATAMDGNSTSGHWNDYYRIDIGTGVVSRYTEGNHLSWSPDCRHFVTCFGRDLGPYGPPKYSRARSVWVSPLLVGDAKTGKETPIVRGLVYVSGADWRPNPEKAR